jgi:hypothetical protein
MTDEQENEEYEAKVDKGLTRFEDYRYKYLSTIVTVTVVLTYSALIIGNAYGFTEARVGGGTWSTYSFAFLTVVAYSVGVDVLKQVAEYRKNR